MNADNLWIQHVDHRISTALIFFLLLILLGNGQRRRMFPLRALLSFAALCAVSWVIRWLIDTRIPSRLWQGVGYGAHIFALSALYLGAYALCYHATRGELHYRQLLALTIVKMAWNTFKSSGYGIELAGIPALWSTYSVLGAMVSYVVYGGVCALACGVLRVTDGDTPMMVPDKPMYIMAAGFVFCQMILEFCGHVFTADSDALFLYYFCALIYSCTIFIMLLVLARLMHTQQDNADMRAFIENKMRYYQMSRDGITSLQVKCHDLKHQIAAIRSRVGKASFDKYMDRLEDSINEYGTVVDCGNETVNVVLTEKNILCSTCGVKFSYIIDGHLFDFMTEMEIYSLFGNALDNALESCVKVEDKEQRVIALRAMAHGDIIVLHVENSCQEEPDIVDGMPVTTKQGAGHGFGLRSIQSIAEKYAGVASVQMENHIFKLTVLMRPRAVSG